MEIGVLSGFSVSWQIHLRADQKSPRTVRMYRDSLAQLIRVIGDKPADKVTRDDLRTFLSVRGQEVTTSTLSIEYRAVRVFFNWLVDEGILAVTPTLKVKQPKVYEQPVPLYKPGEIQAILDTCDKSFTGLRDTAMILTLLDTGARRAELVNILTEDVDLANGSILLRVTKNHEPREVPISATTAKALERYLRARNEHAYFDYEELWLGQKGPMQESGVNQMLERRGKKAGVEGVRPHRFRHQAAHEFASAGASPSDSMAVFGWKSVIMTTRYGKSGAKERAFNLHRKSSPVDRLNKES